MAVKDKKKTPVTNVILSKTMFQKETLFQKAEPLLFIQTCPSFHIPAG